jgi:hypothetical protein
LAIVDERCMDWNARMGKWALPAVMASQCIWDEDRFCDILVKRLLRLDLEREHILIENYGRSQEVSFSYCAKSALKSASNHSLLLRCIKKRVQKEINGMRKVKF